MEEFSSFIRKQFRVSLIFLLLGISLGFLYSLQLLGLGPSNVTPLHGVNTRSAHISLMLYGFIPLMLTMLPFSLCAKDEKCPAKGLQDLNTFFLIWYIFLIFMTSSLLFGVRRNLTFYDFSYELNFLLAFAGFFYIRAIFRFEAAYSTPPRWLSVTKWTALAAPFVLIALMNPSIGQVEATVKGGPHGDHTLGMSLALIPVFYLAIKTRAKNLFEHRGKLFWQIPLAGYSLSLIWRGALGEPSYNIEWAFLSLTLCYIPLLLIWLKEARLRFSDSPFLIISIYAFLLIDIEGNILVIPAVRALFHRNDLVIGHAHIAIAVSIFSLAMSIAAPHLRKLNERGLALAWVSCIGVMVLALSVAGLREAGLVDVGIRPMWALRSLSGFLALLSALLFLLPASEISIDLGCRYNLYHLAGVISDGFGGVALLLFGPLIYNLFGLPFSGGYQYVVFGFVASVGLLHLFGLMQEGNRRAFAFGTSWIRLITAATFYGLYKSDILGTEALVIGSYDFLFALIYLTRILEPKTINTPETPTQPSSSKLHLHSDKIRG
jgi:cytochrome c oxidase cbb3-type subunit 1